MEIYHYIEPSKSDWIYYPGFSREETLGDNTIWFDGSSGWFGSNEFDVAIIGVPEARNSERTVSADAPQEIRKWLYGMRNHSTDQIVADLGNIRGNSLNDRYMALREVVEFLEHRGVVVLVLGGSQDLTIPVCGFIEKAKRKLTLAVVDAFIDFDPSDEAFSDSSFLNKLFTDFGKENIEDLNLLGCQTYYCSGKQEGFMSENHFRLDRLKDLRGGNIENIDVLLRQMEVLSFDFSAIKGQPVLYDGYRMPNGFSEEEACRIFWYAGASDVLKVAGMFNMPEPVIENHSTAPLAAQMCWHFLEGRGARCGDYPVRPLEEYELKVVCLDEYDETLRFYFNPENKRWWIMVPDNPQERLVPCSKEDYQTATEQELPSVWWHYFIKNREE